MVFNWVARAGGKPYAKGLSVEVSDPRGAEQMRVGFGSTQTPTVAVAPCLPDRPINLERFADCVPAGRRTELGTGGTRHAPRLAHRQE
eukprot:4384939-Prymnesium_polylepis.1